MASGQSVSCRSCPTISSTRKFSDDATSRRALARECVTSPERIDFPARKEDLMRQAKNNGADAAAVMEDIEAMPEADYENMADVMKGCGEADDASERRRH
jgi:Protein of unknown function (DUF2795)